jgi:hypothetical protein
MTSSTDYGTYRLTYTPPNDPGADYPLINIEMSTSGDASVDQMLRFYEAFLAAAGYILKGELQIVEPEKDSSLNFQYQGLGYPDANFGVRPSMANDVIDFSNFV